jgi:hypothetical protein
MSIPRNLSIHADTLDSSGNFTSITDTGNLTFTGTGNRITGDFSNATLTSRVSFQTSTTNGNTALQILPNGTSVTSTFFQFNNSDPTNAAYGGIQVNTSTASFLSGISGTGTYLPMTFFTGGSERMRLDTSGNLGIGTSSPSTKLQVQMPTSGTGVNFRSTGGTNNPGLFFSTNESTTVSQIDASGSTSGILAFATSGTERMRIDASGNVGIGTTANASAILDAQSTTKGVRMPNMTTTQKNAISSPAAGLMVFDTTLAKLCVYSGSAWQTVTSV